MNKNEYLVVHKNVLPDVFSKVIEAKRILKSGDHGGISDVVKLVGISRSTYYKYCDYVFSFSENKVDKRVTLSLLLVHESGVLSTLLDLIAKSNGNIITISQDAPIENIANASITFDISYLTIGFTKLIENIEKQKGVKRLNLVAIE